MTISDQLSHKALQKQPKSAPFLRFGCNFQTSWVVVRSSTKLQLQENYIKRTTLTISVKQILTVQFLSSNQNPKELRFAG